MIRNFASVAFALFAGLALSPAYAQSPAPQPSQTAPSQTQTAPPNQTAPPPGKVLFSRDQSSTPEPPQSTPQNPAVTPTDDPLKVTDAERTALTFTAYDLDVHLAPATSGIAVRALITVRNDSAAPLTRLVLQITSSLHWDAFSTRSLAKSASPVLPLTFATRLIDTDADHTGSTSEAVISLPHPLAPGASMPLTALYSGLIPSSAERLERIGAPADKALSEDWDTIAPNDPDNQTTGTALRGFGYVLWYPVAAAPVFLGDGAKLFQAVGSTKLRQSAATVRLRLAIEYLGEPPDAAFFCGRREQLIAVSDNPNLPVAESPGIASATFDPQPLGFRTLNLFVTGSAANDTGTSANPRLIAAVTSHDDVLPAYSAAAALVEPLLTDWLGPHPQTTLTILDHPGQPFEDDALLIRPMHADDPATLAPSLLHSLTHSWIRSSHPWIDEGLPEFLSLLWTERTAGRPVALAQLDGATRALAIAEPQPSASPSSPASSSSASDSTTESAPPAGPGLDAASSELFYRTKAAAVWWMLRGIVGDQALQQSLQAYRQDPKLDRDPIALQTTLEHFSQKSLRWFFDDWVYRDCGLPDLSIVSVTPSHLDSSTGGPAGWLVAVDVHNDGDAAAEVPVTVRSAGASQTQRLRIAAHSSASTRIVFAGTPDQVQVNDGGVPETQSSIHTRQLLMPGH